MTAADYDYVWTCRDCGKQHRGLPLDHAYRAPDDWFRLPENEREQRTDFDHLDTDTCCIDRRDFFVRGVIEIPIIGMNEIFRWGVWSSLSKDSFKRVLELWDAEVIADPPYLGSLSNELPLSLYPSTLNLKLLIHLTTDGTRPRFEIEPTDHPLALEQRNGITTARVEEFAALSKH